MNVSGQTREKKVKAEAILKYPASQAYVKNADAVLPQGFLDERVAAMHPGQPALWQKHNRRCVPEIE
jgi:hypothetical protein